MKCYGMLQNASVIGFGAINPIQDGGQVPPPRDQFFPVTSTNVEISPKNFLKFSLIILLHWYKLSRP